MIDSSSTTLLFLKLGGSLITDKNIPRAARLDVLQRLADEIASALHGNPGLRLLLGNGAGSFGHVPAKKYGTRQGVRTPENWRGFAEVWREAAALNRLVTEALHAAGLPAVAFPPSSAVIARDGRVVSWDLQPIQAALQAGLLPVVHGDVIFDQARGGTILSTEDLFDHLAQRLRPQRVLLAGIEAGVWADFPACTRLVKEINPRSFAEILPALGGSSGTDVTGGMASKVLQSLALAQALPGLEVLIFSGLEARLVQSALLGGQPGTLVKG
jgi:isopentenyl phosphate kinase